MPNLPYKAPRLNVGLANIQAAPVSHGGKRFSAHLPRPGLWRLTNKNAELYGINILNSGGGSGMLSVYNGNYERIWAQPSAFTGSFTPQGFAQNGIIVDNGYGQSIGVNVTVNWKE